MVVRAPRLPPLPLLFTVNDSSADRAVGGTAGQKHCGEKGLCNWTRRISLPCFYLKASRSITRASRARERNQQGIGFSAELKIHNKYSIYCDFIYMCSFKNKKPSCLCSVCRREIITVTSVSLAMPSTSRRSFRSSTHSANNNLGVLQPREPAVVRTTSLCFPEMHTVVQSSGKTCGIGTRRNL